MIFYIRRGVRRLEFDRVEIHGILRLCAAGETPEAALTREIREELAARIARLDFASGEFPTACEVAVSALGCEYLAIVPDDCRNNINGFHNSPFRRRIIVVDRIKEAADSLSEAPNLADRSRIYLVIGCDKA